MKGHGGNFEAKAGHHQNRRQDECRIIEGKPGYFLGHRRQVGRAGEAIEQGQAIQ